MYAIDLHPELAEELAAREGLRVAFLESLEAVPDAELSALVAADVLEHLDDLPAWIDESSRTLRPDGRLVVSGPTENMLYRIGRSIAGFSGKGHYHHRNIADIRLALEEKSYMVERRVVLPSRAVPLFEVLRFMREPG